MLRLFVMQRISYSPRLFRRIRYVVSSQRAALSILKEVRPEGVFFVEDLLLLRRQIVRVVLTRAEKFHFVKCKIKDAVLIR